MRWNDQLKGGKADYLRPQDFPKKTLLAGMRHELEHTKSHRLAMEIAMDHLVEDSKYYEKLKKIERHQNPSTSRRQQRFMCAEYGRKRRGQRTKTGMSRGQLKEFCMARRKNSGDERRSSEIAEALGWNVDRNDGALRHPQIPGLFRFDSTSWYYRKDDSYQGRFKPFDAEGAQHDGSIRRFIKKLTAKYKHRGRRKQNPHLTSGKWRFIGMFEKRDIPSVRRILKIHGMKNKVTKDHLKQEPGMRELYVERGGYDTAYRAITRLFEGGRAA